MDATPVIHSSKPMHAAAPLAAAAEAPTAHRRRALAPLEPVSGRARWLLGLAFFVMFVLAWAFFTFGGFVSPTFLASPLTMVKEGVLLFTKYNFLHDVYMTVWRVFGGFILAALVAVPLGIAMGTWKSVEAFFEPFVSFCRYLPAAAFIPPAGSLIVGTILLFADAILIVDSNAVCLEGNARASQMLGRPLDGIPGLPRTMTNWKPE